MNATAAQPDTAGDNVQESAGASPVPTISAISFKGLAAHTADGKPARFALLDEDGNVIASGADIARAAYAASVNAYRQYLMGQGHMQVLTSPGH